MVGGYFNTIDEMLQYYYPHLWGREMRKDADVIAGSSPTTGAFQERYGAKLFLEILTNEQTLGALPKIPYPKSGFRSVTVAGETSGGGVADGGAVPATVKPTMDELEVTCKLHSRTFAMGRILNKLAGKDDAVTWEELRKETELEFKDVVNTALLANVTTTITNDFESLDRVCSSKGEEDSCGDVDAGDNDIYGIDRDTATYYDATVSHGSDTDRTFQVSQVDTVLTTAMKYWKGDMTSKMIITGHDTFFRWGQKLRPMMRFSDARAKFTVNGVQTVAGVEGATPISSYMNIPVVLDGDVVQDTLGRIYVIDGNQCGFALLTPPVYSEAGGTDAEQIMLGKHAKEGMFVMEGELYCTGFHNQGKVRDLK